MLSRLRHPCVVRLLGACLAPPDLCIVEELVEGGSLHAYLHGPGARRGAGDDGGRASKDDDVPVDVRVSTALDVCSDVARAMAYLAARGVTHRDLKSQNVLLVFPERAARQIDCGSAGAANLSRRRLRAKVADFGIAKSRDDCVATGVEAILATNGTTGVITGGGAAGTPAWMAPELFRGAPVAERGVGRVQLRSRALGVPDRGRRPGDGSATPCRSSSRWPWRETAAVPPRGERKSEDAEDAKTPAEKKKTPPRRRRRAFFFARCSSGAGRRTPAPGRGSRRSARSCGG